MPMPGPKAGNGPQPFLLGDEWREVTYAGHGQQAAPQVGVCLCGPWLESGPALCLRPHRTCRHEAYQNTACQPMARKREMQSHLRWHQRRESGLPWQGGNHVCVQSLSRSFVNVAVPSAATMPLRKSVFVRQRTPTKPTKPVSSVSSVCFQPRIFILRLASPPHPDDTP